MDIRPLQGSITPPFIGKPAANDESPPVMKDLVTLSGTPQLSSTSRASIADQLFKAREALWTSEYQSGSGISRGFFELPGGGIIAGTYCDLAVINPADGKTLWQRDLMEKAVTNLSTNPALIARDGSLLIGTTNGTLYSLDPATGKENWNYRTNAYATAPAQAADGTIYVQKDKDLVALNADGTEKFQAPIGRDRQKISYVDSQGAVYVQSDDDIFAIGPDGSSRWQVQGRDIIGFSDDRDRLYTTASKDVP